MTNATAAPQPCTVEGCEKPNAKGGICWMHRKRLQRIGAPLPGRPAREYKAPPSRVVMTPGDRLRDRGWNVTEAGCWEFRGYCAPPSGYGRVANGLAHRIAYADANGPIPAGMFVCHSCDNPPCVNPAHLFLGTPAENIADAVSKGRMARGERSGSSRLTAENVIEIRARDAAGEMSRSIAASFDISHSTVSQILHRRSWKHI